MKLTSALLLALAVCLPGLTGCKKKDQQTSTQPSNNINADWPKLDTEFAAVSQDVKDNVASAKRFFRYGQVPQALMEMEKLSKNPNLTEPQKKLVNELIEELKQITAKAP